MPFYPIVDWFGTSKVIYFLRLRCKVDHDPHIWKISITNWVWMSEFSIIRLQSTAFLLLFSVFIRWENLRKIWGKFEQYFWEILDQNVGKNWAKSAGDRRKIWGQSVKNFEKFREKLSKIWNFNEEVKGKI